MEVMLIARNLVSATLPLFLGFSSHAFLIVARHPYDSTPSARMHALLFVRLLREFNRPITDLDFTFACIFTWINEYKWKNTFGFYNHLKLSRATFSQCFLSMSFRSSSLMMQQQRKLCSPYSSWRTMILMRITLSPFSVILFFLFCYMCTLCYFPCPLLFRVFLVSFFLPERSFRTRLCRLHDFGATHTRVRLYFITVNHQHSFFPSFFSFLPQLYDWPHSADTCMIFVFLQSPLPSLLPLPHIFTILVSVA